MFKLSARELGSNFIDRNARHVIVNLTWFQNMCFKFLQNFLDPETVSRQVVSDRPDADDLKRFIYPSQLEKLYGGTSPNVTKFWPPTMPDMPEIQNESAFSVPHYTMVPRKDYPNFVKENQGLVKMPRCLREDLPLLSTDVVPVKKVPMIIEDMLSESELESDGEDIPREEPSLKAPY